MLCGAHQSVAGGLARAFERAAGDECQAIQIFTKNSNMWREPALTSEQVEAFRAAHAAQGHPPVLAHTSYLINPATQDDAMRARSVAALVAEVERCTSLGVAYCVLHPGAHNGAGEEAGIQKVIAALDEVHAKTAPGGARILLENTAGQGSCIGHRFEHLGAIFAGVRDPERLGVCIDTQHSYAAGYDLSTAEGYASTFEALAREVGLANVRAFHLNDSKKALGSRVDRHEHLGEGELGLPLFWRLVNDPRFADTPGVVETEPREGDHPYRQEVQLLKSFFGGAEPPALPKPSEAFSLELAPAAPKKRRK